MTEVEEEMNLEELVKVYLTIRGERERIEAEWKVKNNELLNDLKTLEIQLLTKCNENNASSIKTASGTVIRQLHERYTVADGDLFRKFVMDNNVPELFEQRIAQTRFKEFIAEQESASLPPGVNVMREFNVVVRKPS